MKTEKSLIILMILLNLNSYAQDSDSIIYWNSTVKLSWKDFKGRVPDTTEHKVAGSYLDILTNGEVSFGLPNYRVYSTFNRYMSWSKDTTINMLSHEQGHFDIGEIYARKIRRSLQELREQRVDSIDEYLKTIYYYFDEFKIYNEKYDLETAHGVYKLKQLEWNKKIAKELCELKKFEVDYSDYIEE